VKADAADDEMVASLEQAACAYLLEKTGEGLDTRIGEMGVKLSGGERQRVAIARALLRQPRPLIFDEATSALDSISEQQVTETVRRIAHRMERITILIAHRLSTILHADTIRGGGGGGRVTTLPLRCVGRLLHPRGTRTATIGCAFARGVRSTRRTATIGSATWSPGVATAEMRVTAAPLSPRESIALDRLFAPPERPTPLETIRATIDVYTVNDLYTSCARTSSSTTT